MLVCEEEQRVVVVREFGLIVHDPDVVACCVGEEVDLNDLGGVWRGRGGQGLVRDGFGEVVLAISLAWFYCREFGWYLEPDPLWNGAWQ